MNLLTLGEKIIAIGEKIATEAELNIVSDNDDECPVDIRWDYIQKGDGSKNLRLEVEIWAEGPAILCQEIAGSLGIERKI